MSPFLTQRSPLFSCVALVVKNPLANAGDVRRGFDSWVGKIPWRRTSQPTPVFSPGESHGQRSLVGYSPWGRTESMQLSTHTFSQAFVLPTMSTAFSLECINSAVILFFKQSFPFLIRHAQISDVGGTQLHGYLLHFCLSVHPCLFLYGHN